MGLQHEPCNEAWNRSTNYDEGRWELLNGIDCIVCAGVKRTDHLFFPFVTKSSPRYPLDQLDRDSPFLIATSCIHRYYLLSY